jgi:amidase
MRGRGGARLAGLPVAIKDLIDVAGVRTTYGSPLSVQGPMARNVADVALFLDATAGECPRDPLTFPAPPRSFAAAVATPVAPKRVAYTADFGGKVLVDRETREICAAAARRFTALGAVVEEGAPELGDIEPAFLALRSQHFVVERELMLATHRAQIKPDIVWNTRAQPARDAERARRRRA